MAKLRPEVRRTRSPEYDVHPLIVNRWSSRAFTSESMEPDEFMPLFEAARWAPSSFNAQPWRFVYRTRTDDGWEAALGVLTEKNQRWAQHAAVLVLVASRRRMEYNDRESYTHSFDTGAAWENLALEATDRGLTAHAMNGFDKEQAYEVFEVPELFRAETMIAIGKRAPEDSLPGDLRKEPSGRKALGEIVIEGSFD